MPNTAKGLYYPDGTTDLSPLETVMANMQVSVDSYLGANSTIHPIANVAGRAAIVALYAPTAASPLFAWRQDAPAGQNLEYTTNGSTWAYYAQGSDTGWTAVTAGSGWTSLGALVRIKNGVVHLRGFISGTTPPSGAALIGTIPVGYRPSGAGEITLRTVGNANNTLHPGMGFIDGSDGNIYVYPWLYSTGAVYNISIFSGYLLD